MMQPRAVLIDGSDTVTYNTEPSPSLDWIDDGRVRWLNVCGASQEEIVKLFNNLGIEGNLIAIKSKMITGSNGSRRVIFISAQIPRLQPGLHLRSGIT
jgi:hypothetical protein